MIFKNQICSKYNRRVLDELDFALAIDFKQIIEKGIETFFRPVAGMDFFKYALIDYAKPALKTMDNMKLVYLCSLFEGFSKEYISHRSSVPLEKIKTGVLNKHNRAWHEYSKENKLGANSLLNLYYVNFIFEKEYLFSILQDLNKITREIGALRNVIVHHDGVIPNDDFVLLLPNTLEHLNLPKQLGEIIILTDEMLSIYFKDTRKVFKFCDDAMN